MENPTVASRCGMMFELVAAACAKTNLTNVDIFIQRTSSSHTNQFLHTVVHNQLTRKIEIDGIPIPVPMTDTR